MDDRHEAVELKPDACPLCGGMDIYVAPDETGSGGQWVPPVHVGCKACSLDLVDLVTDTREGAIAAWNRRAPDPSAQAEIERLRGEVNEARKEAGDIHKRFSGWLDEAEAKRSQWANEADAADARALAAEARVSELERERDEARAVAGYPGALSAAVPLAADELEGLAAKWPRIVNTIMEAERAREASQARVAALEAGLRELADSLEEEIKGRADNELPRRIARDLEPVRAARALLEANSHD